MISEIPEPRGFVPTGSNTHHGPSIARVVGCIGLTAAFGLAMIVFGTLVLASYGWALFVYLPVVLGFVPVALIGPAKRVSIWRATMSALSSVVLVFVVMFVVGIEGVICLLMAAPLWIPLVLVGSLLGYLLVKAMNSAGRSSVGLLIVLTVLVPTIMGAEYLTQQEPHVYPVSTSLIIDAPPEIVWQEVVEFDELPEPEHWVFRTGVAYPTHARIEGRGVDAVRYCVFTTGAFVEPIEVWDEPRLLRFAVTENPAPMQERSLFSQIHPPHLDGFLVSEKGQFELIPMDDGGTKLVGTTWYQHGMGPDAYWRMMSDYIIRQIHTRVLEHIKSRAEIGNDFASGASS